VTVLTGSDVSVLAPPHKTSTTTTTLKKKRHATATTTTTKPVTQITVVDPSAVKHDTELSAPTDVTQALQPWDRVRVALTAPRAIRTHVVSAEVVTGVSRVTPCATHLEADQSSSNAATFTSTRPRAVPYFERCCQ